MQDNICCDKEKRESARQYISDLEGHDNSPREGIPWLGMLFLLLIGPVDIGLTLLFEVLRWNVVGHDYSGAAETGAVVSLVIAVVFAAPLIYLRRAIVSGAEIGMYWLGCAAAFLFAWFGIFSVGLHVPGGIVAGAFFIVISAVLIVLRRGASLSDAEAGLYWLGCTAASFYALAECVHILETWWGKSAWDWWPYNYYIACIIALFIAAITAVALARWRKDTDRYWLAGTLLAMVTALVGTRVTGNYATDFYAFLPLIALISALVLAFRERKGNGAPLSVNNA